MADLFNLFTYGTLQPRYPTQRERSLRAFHPQMGVIAFREGIVEGFDLYDYERVFPYVLRGNGKVYGYVLRCKVPDETTTLFHIDRYESEGFLYHREQVAVAIDIGVIIAWMYIGIEKRFHGTMLNGKPKPKPIAAGKWAW